LIQADFIVLPGRESLNYEASWNHWLIERTCDLCKEAIEEFQVHDKWKYHFLPIFDFARYDGQSSFDRLFFPKLIAVLERCREKVLSVDGEWVKPIQAVKADREVMGLVKEEELKHIFGKEKRYVHPDFQTGSLSVDELQLLSLISEYYRGLEFLKKKAVEREAPDFFRKLYLKTLKKYKVARRDYSGDYARRKYLSGAFILTSENKLSYAHQVYLPIVEPKVLILLQKVGLTGITFLHPDILEKASEEEKQELYQFFELCGIGKLDYSPTLRKYLEKEILAKISTSAPMPKKEELLSLTRKAREIAEAEDITIGEIYVLTKRGDFCPAKQVFFSSEYNPVWDWEKNSQYLPIVNFLDDIYLESRERGTVTSWHKFFCKVGVTDEVSKTLVDQFAMKYARGELKPLFGELQDVSQLDLGYDLRNANAFVEVKGQRQGSDGAVQLTPNETKAARLYKDSYHLFIVSEIPANPQGYLVSNPADKGEIIGYLLVPPEVWKRYKLE
jgi:hypothetical protein